MSHSGWSEWGWDEQTNREGRWRLNSKGKYVYQYRDSPSASNQPRRSDTFSSYNSNNQNSSLPENNYQDYDEDGNSEQYQWSGAQSVNVLSANFATSSTNNTGTGYQTSYTSNTVSADTNYPTSPSMSIPQSQGRSIPDPRAPEYQPPTGLTQYSGYQESREVLWNQYLGSTSSNSSREQDDEYLLGSSVDTVVPEGRASMAESTSMGSPRITMAQLARGNARSPTMTSGAYRVPPLAQEIQSPSDYISQDRQPFDTPQYALSDGDPGNSVRGGSRDNTPQPLNKEIHKNITTLTRQVSKEALDPQYKVHSSGYFTPGRVFKVLWSEPEGETMSSAATEVTGRLETIYRGEHVYASIRRFIVAAADRGHCQCLPILTYGGQATNKHGVKAEDHAVIHCRGSPATLLRGESLSLRPIMMDPKNPRDKLEPTSRINYAKIYTVEHNVKVQFIGKISESSKATFVTDWDVVWYRKRTMGW